MAIPISSLPSSRPNNFGLIALLLVVGIFSDRYACAEKSLTITGSPASNETRERAVDQVALLSQEKSIATLNQLLKKYRGTRQEQVFLIRLADMYSQTAGIQFRIAHGESHRKSQSLDLSAYKKTMRQTISTLTELIAKYPNFEEIPHAYFLRGKSFEELEQTDAATKDYLHLVKSFPDWEECIAAYMSLAEFSIKANDHPRAIAYLMEVEKHPEHPVYPFALYKLAWSHYNLKDIPHALQFAEKHVAYYNGIDRQKDKGGLASSDEALKENTLSDITVFYLEGFEQKLSQYSIEEALSYFKKLESGPLLGKMLVKFSKLLRSHGYESDIVKFKSDVLASESQRPEVLEVVSVVFEFQFNKRRFELLANTAQDFVMLYPKHANHEYLIQARKTLLETAENIQTSVIKNKNADGVAELSHTLAILYDAFTKIVPEADPRIPKVHYNLAETLFEIKDYEGAVYHYRWIVDSKRGVSKETSDAGLKAIAARYEVLRSKKLIPESLTPVAYKEGDSKPIGSLDPLLSQWISWLGTSWLDSNEKQSNFGFEANRALYYFGVYNVALKRLDEFVRSQPHALEATASANLVLDTYIKSQNWPLVKSFAHDYRSIKKWQDKEFPKKLTLIEADAHYKITEAAFANKDYKTTIDLAETLVADYDSPRTADALWLAAQATKENGQLDRSELYLTKLLKSVAQFGKEAELAYTTKVLGLRSDLRLARYSFEDASLDLLTLLEGSKESLKLDSKQLTALRKKTMLTAWLSSKAATLKKVLNSKSVCGSEDNSDCEHFEALYLLQLQNEPLAPALEETQTKHAFNLARKGSESNQTLWALVALSGAKHLAWRDRLVMLRQISQGYESLDALTQLALIPSVSKLVPLAYELNRSQMGEVGPLRADSRYITRRIEVIREMENVATKLVKLPWSGVRAQILDLNAELYLDLSKGIASLPGPKDLSEADRGVYEDTIRKIVIPFEEKAQDMKAKAFELASQAGVERQVFKKISESYFKDNPSVASKIKPSFESTAITAIAPALSLEWLAKADPDSRWNKSDFNHKDPKIRFKGLLAKSIREGETATSAFLILEAKDKGYLNETSLALARVVTLASLGAQGEALFELKRISETIKDSPDTIKWSLDTLLGFSIEYMSKSNADWTLGQISRLDPKSSLPKQYSQVQSWIKSK